MHRRTVAAGLALALILTHSQAFAAPVSSKREQAKAVKSQIDSLDERLEVASEDYNVAATHYAKLNGQVAATNAKLKRIRKRTRRLQKALNSRVNHMYRSGPLEMVDVLLGATSFEDLASTWDFLNQMNEEESGMVSDLKDARSEAETVKADLVVTQKKARKVYDRMSERKRYVESKLAERQSKLKGLEKEIDRLEAEQRARALASSSGGWDYGDPTNAPRGAVVAIAKRYIGRPYVWGASGPGSFDCSGFTMFVYAQVGVRLPHSSAAQIGYGQRVSRANLAPGDLVFFYRPIHHVGIYVGGGRFIHAPNSGSSVRIDSLAGHSSYSGACRP